MVGRPMKRLVLHVGLPKTSSTALQAWCYANREALRSWGVHYPDSVVSTEDPKHQWLVSDLLLNSMDERLPVALAPGEDTLFLSAEGLTNRLPGFPPEATAQFRRLTAGLEVTVLVFFREAEPWTVSYWKQDVLEFDREPLTFEQFCQLPRVKFLLDRDSVLAGLDDAFAPSTVVVGSHESGWVGPLS